MEGGCAPRGPVFNYTLYCQHLSKGCMIISSKWFGNIAVFNLNNKCSNYLFYSCDSCGNNEYTYFFMGIGRHAIHVHFLVTFQSFIKNTSINEKKTESKSVFGMYTRS